MKIPHVDFVKEKLGEEALNALGAIYNAVKGKPPSVPAERFRADNHKWLDLLDSLEQRYSLIKRGDKGKDYLLKSHALPVIDAAYPILTKMQRLYERMTELYPIHLSQRIDIDTLLGGFEGDRNEWIEALYYLTDMSGVWSHKSLGFPYADDSSMSISESVLKKDSVAALLSQFYKWHYVEPRNNLHEWDRGIDDEQSVTFFPQNPKNSFPSWYDNLDGDKKDLINEIEAALTNKLSALPAMGLRTLLDVLMVETIGDIGGFEKKLRKFSDDGHITKKQSDLIQGVLNVGHAASHRAYFPDNDALKTCVDIVIHLMESMYSLSPRMQRLEENTPKRKCDE